MFYLGWIVLTGTGVLASIAVFLWALRSGQFADQGRARYLPLFETDPLSPASTSPKLPAAAYGLLLVLGVGVIAMLSPVILTLLRTKG
jgi:cbb3-type cytochrome oxidase maturation protein